MNILLISIAFPPRNSPGAQRIYSWAKYWSQAGHNVTVLTTNKGDDSNGLFTSQDQEINYPYKIINVKSFIGDLITKKWMQREKSSYSLPNGKTLNSNFFNKIVNSNLKSILDFFIPYIPAMVRAGNESAKQESFDLIVSSYSPPTSHWVASLLKMTLKIPWVADFRDIWVWNSADAAGLTLAMGGIEKISISQADLILTVSTPITQEYARRYPIPCLTLENGFDPEEYTSLQDEKLFPEDGNLRFVYTGAVYGKRNPEPLFAALRSIKQSKPNSHKAFELIFYGRNLNMLVELARIYGLEGSVKILGLVDRPTALRAQRDADALILLEDEDYAVDGMLTSKIFEYFRAGKPVLGIGMSENSTLGKLMCQSGLGFPLGKDINIIKNFITTNFIERSAPEIHPKEEVINRYSRKTLALRALTYFEDLLTK